MEFLIFTLLNVSLSLLVLSVYDGILLRRIINNSISPDASNYTRKEDNLEESNEGVSSYEEERIAREKAFDTRIALLKQELNYANPSKGYIAEELDPNVYNLPHNSVTSLINSDVDEVAN